ncbi:MAG: AraC family transcriptional regulator ligand-binding domain-containing protein, partial [Casimicrobiaceae bacterium]
MAELGYDLELFDDAETRVSYAVRNRIVGHCAARAGCPHFGLLVGQHNGLHTFGLVGLLVKYAPDVGTAMRSFIRYLHLHVLGGSVNLTVQGDSAMLTWDVHQPGLEALDHTGDGALATLQNIMHELCGPDWR